MVHAHLDRWVSLVCQLEDINARKISLVDGMVSQCFEKLSGEGGPYVVPLNDTGKFSNQASSCLIKLVRALGSNAIEISFVSAKVCATILA